MWNIADIVKSRFPCKDTALGETAYLYYLTSPEFQNIGGQLVRALIHGMHKSVITSQYFDQFVDTLTYLFYILGADAAGTVHVYTTPC